MCVDLTCNAVSLKTSVFILLLHLGVLISYSSVYLIIGLESLMITLQLHLAPV
jgi:hypothetical protein